MKQFIFRHKFLKYTIVTSFWLLLWYVIYFWINDNSLIASPYNVIICLFNFIFNFNFWHTIALSIIRIFSGFLLAFIVGTILAIVTVKFDFINLFFKPIISIIKTIPIVSLIILVTTFINMTFIPTFISFITVLPVTFNNVYYGIKQKNNIKGKKQKIMLTDVTPYIISAVSSGIGFAWKSGISAEVLVKLKESVGYEIYFAKSNCLITELFTWTAIVVIICFLLENFIIFIVKLLTNKKNITF